MKGVCFKGPLFSRSGLTSKTERGMEEEEDVIFIKREESSGRSLSFPYCMSFSGSPHCTFFIILRINTTNLPNNSKYKYYKQTK